MKPLNLALRWVFLAVLILNSLRPKLQAQTWPGWALSFDGMSAYLDLSLLGYPDLTRSAQ